MEGNSLEFKKPTDEEMIIKEVELQKNFIMNQNKAEAKKVIDEFMETIKKSYSDYDKYRLFHVLEGTPINENCTEFDFPGEDSVTKFINKIFDNFLKMPLSIKQ